MSAMLRAAGPDFDVDRFLADCTLSVSSIHRKGHRRGGPKSPKHERSGLNVLVSEATFEQFPRRLKMRSCSCENTAKRFAACASFRA
jgi:hypothetical protein